jgi:dolichol-phosphate mannosyltransferase
MPIIVIPTYNENATIKRLIQEIFQLCTDQEIQIVVVDDNSPDGTAKTVATLQPLFQDQLHLIIRPEKGGLAGAYLEGFRFALKRGFKQIIQMDADFSHRPEHIPQFLHALQSADLVIGSRYLTGSQIQKWPWYRQILSRMGIRFSKFFTRLQLSDPTSGFKAWKSDLLSKIIHEPIRSKGFSFQMETNTLAQKRIASITEIPIIFNDRSNGKSKMSLSIIIESIIIALKMRANRS